MAKEGYIAFDLGAESGRAMLAVLSGDKIELFETHRFANTPQRMPSGLHWNLTELWANILKGLKLTAQAAKEKKVKLVAVGVDTWGVDFGFVGKSGQLLGLPFAYRDDRNGPAYQKAIAKLGDRAIYDATGIQFMPFNSLFQVYAQHLAEPAVIANAKHMLMIPDLLHYFLSGVAVNEETNASTTQMVNPRSEHGTWTKPLLKKLGVPSHFLGKTVPAGSVIGKLTPAVCKETGLEALKVIAPGTHDTASAVAAVPVDEKKTPDWAYLSSGTWSLMGAELDKPCITPASFTASFTNERGVEGKIRFLKNISGLWLVQEVRRDLIRQGKDLSYAELTKLAGKSEAFRTLVDPNHAPFASPGDMLSKIAAFAKKTKQPAPRTPGEYVRACLESLALIYRHTLDTLETVLGRKFTVLHVVGGGGQNMLLNQLTADAIDRTVIVGPFEATAIGNALTQAIGKGTVKDLAHLRRIVRRSYNPVTYRPANAAGFAQQRARFNALLGK
jgi:rhamnulokinase